MKIQEVQRFLKNSDQPVWHQQPCHLKGTYIIYFSHSDARFELQQIILTMSTCLNALSCCHMIGRFNICVNKQVYIPNNVADECIYTYMGIWDGILGVEWEKL